MTQLQIVRESLMVATIMESYHECEISFKYKIYFIHFKSISC